MTHRILIISHGHPAFSKGGAEIASYNLHREYLKRSDCTSLYLARRGDEVPGHYATLFSSTAANEILFHSHIDHFVFSHQGLGDITREFRLLLEDYEPTVVHFHHYTHLGLEMIREVKNWNKNVSVVVTLHEYLAICDNFGQMVTTQGRLCYESSPTRCAICKSPRTSADFFFREQFIKSFFQLVDQFISPSQFLIDRYVAWGLPANKISFLENGLPDAVTITDQAESLVDDFIPVRFGYFGQINPFKGLDIFLEAVTLLPKLLKNQIRVEVHGSGLENQSSEFQEKINELLEKNQKTVKFLGAYEPEDVIGLMHGVDWVVVPSVWWENSPLVIQEAFAAKKPLIVSNIGGMAEKVKDGVYGYQFRNRNAADLARVMEMALSAEVYRSFQTQLPTPVVARESGDNHINCYDKVSSYNLKK